MAKKKSDSLNIKSAINSVVEKSINSIISVVAQHSAHIIDWIKSLPRIKRKIKHILASVALALAGVVVLALGISDYLAAVFPGLANGLSHIIVGVVLLFVAMLYGKLD